MTSVTYNQNDYFLDTDETVLKCLLRHKIEYPYSCEAGICQSCLIKAEKGEVLQSWQIGLPETLKSQNYFLACLAKPKTSLSLTKPNTSECDVEAKILSVAYLNYNVLQLKLLTEKLDLWRPGQYLNFINANNVMRSYSIANLPSLDGFIELHIKLFPEGAMGQWLANASLHGKQVKLRGPFGHCYYHNPEKLSYDMILAGTGTGLAPLIGIIKNALTQTHQGKIILVHGGITDDDIYYQNTLQELSKKNPSFIYDPCVLHTQGSYPEASIEKRMLLHLNHPQKTRIYVCGPKNTTDLLKKSAFLAGVSSQAILSDIFL